MQKHRLETPITEKQDSVPEAEVYADISTFTAPKLVKSQFGYGDSLEY